MDERFASVGGLEICYEEIGSPADPPMLLIMGLGAQSISWPDGFCTLLADRGLRVIRYDNRDVGRSTVLSHLGSPDLRAVSERTQPPPYTLHDMAADAVGLLDALGIYEAHVVGASLGGVVAQFVALDHPGRVRSLGLVMTHPGRDLADPPAPEAAAVLTTPRARTLDARIEQLLHAHRVVGSRGELADPERVRELAVRTWERGWHPEGFARQLAAIVATPGRLAELSGLAMPVVVVHGEADGLVPVSNGHRLAEAIPHARLVTFPEMGHDLPAPLWEPICDAIASNARAGLRTPTQNA
ncbi:MAG TPA: alpha/beta hydrolase [Actinomycetota bacterium]|nr:alpha/beta hydrolase [Actinomycetota bacterium]